MSVTSDIHMPGSQTTRTMSSAAAHNSGRISDMTSSKVVRISGLTASTPVADSSSVAASQTKLEETSRVLDVLQSNRNLLSQNIVLCEDLFTLLKDHKVIPGPMVSDIQNIEDREEANLILLQYVGRLGPRAFYRFCDILGLTGHTFLAEHIRSEVEQAEPTNKSDVYDDVFKRYPAILKVLAPGEQRGLMLYIRDKVTDGIIKTQWKSRSAGDVKLADERNKKVTDSINKDRVIKEKDVEIIKLQGLLEDERNAHRKTQDDVVELDARCHNLQVKYNEQLTIMMDSYNASERAHWETQQRLAVFDRQIKGMNVKIQLYFGTEEYAAQADASNVKVSRLEEGVEMILDQLTDLEKKNRELLAWYEEQRRKLFEALGLDDNGQDLRTAYLTAQEKIKSEVRRLTAEVDLLSMTFELTSIWSLFEAEREKKDPNPEKKKKGTEDLKTNVNILKTAAAKAKEIAADFDYASVLHMIKDRLHEVHMEIEKLKRKNLTYERKIGKLEGEMDLIRMRGFMDDPSQVDKPVTPTVSKPQPKTNNNLRNRKNMSGRSPVPPLNRTPRNNQASPRKDDPAKTKSPLPPIFTALKRDAPLTEQSKPDSGKSRTAEESRGDEGGPRTHTEIKKPVVPDIDIASPRLERETRSLSQDLPAKRQDTFSKRRTSRDRSLLGQADSHELINKHSKQPEPRKLEIEQTFVSEINL